MNKSILLVCMKGDLLLGFIAEENIKENNGYMVYLYRYSTGEIWKEKSSQHINSQVLASDLLLSTDCSFAIYYPLPCCLAQLKLSLISLLSESEEKEEIKCEGEYCVSFPSGVGDYTIPRGEKLLRRTLGLTCGFDDIRRLEGVILKGDKEMYYNLLSLGDLLSSSISSNTISWKEVLQIYNKLARSFCLPIRETPKYTSRIGISLGSGENDIEIPQENSNWRIPLQGNDLSSLTQEEKKILIGQVTAACKFDVRYLSLLQDLLSDYRSEFPT